MGITYWPTWLFHSSFWILQFYMTGRIDIEACELTKTFNDLHECKYICFLYTDAVDQDQDKDKECY